MDLLLADKSALVTGADRGTDDRIAGDDADRDTQHQPRWQRCGGDAQTKARTAAECGQLGHEPVVTPAVSPRQRIRRVP